MCWLVVEAMHCWGHGLLEMFCLARENVLLLMRGGFGRLGWSNRSHFCLLWDETSVDEQCHSRWTECQTSMQVDYSWPVVGDKVDRVVRLLGYYWIDKSSLWAFRTSIIPVRLMPCQCCRHSWNLRTSPTAAGIDCIETKSTCTIASSTKKSTIHMYRFFLF